MTITFRAVIEVLGKPKEHVEKTIKNYVGAIRQSQKYKIIYEEFEPSREHEDGLIAAFVELEIKAEAPIDVLNFCFDYMPSVLEILEPQEVTFTDVELGAFLNDLQSRMHQIEMLAKQIKGERDIQAETTALVLRNFLLVVLNNKNYELKMLSKITGVAEKSLGAFLSALVAEGVLIEKAGFFSNAQLDKSKEKNNSNKNEANVESEPSEEIKEKSGELDGPNVIITDAKVSKKDCAEADVDGSKS